MPQQPCLAIRNSARGDGSQPSHSTCEPALPCRFRSRPAFTFDPRVVAQLPRFGHRGSVLVAPVRALGIRAQQSSGVAPSCPVPTSATRLLSASFSPLPFPIGFAHHTSNTALGSTDRGALNTIGGSCRLLASLKYVGSRKYRPRGLSKLSTPPFCRRSRPSLTTPAAV